MSIDISMLNNLISKRKSKSFSFSIVVPTRNRSGMLENCLKNITNFDYPKNNFEVLVVDNNSKDNTKNVVVKYGFKYIKISKIGPSFARNKGILTAKNQYVICIDDDVTPPNDLLKHYSRILAKHPKVSIVAGKIIAVSTDTKKLKFWLEALGEDTSWVFSQIERKEKRLTVLRFADVMISANMLINKKKFRGKIFDEKFGKVYGKTLIFSEDLALVLDALYKGKEVIYDPSMSTKHNIGKEKLNLSYVINRFFRSGIEHRLLDKEFGDRKVRFYSWNTKMFIKYVLTFIRKPSSHNFIVITREFLFLVGYYWPVSWL